MSTTVTSWLTKAGQWLKSAASIAVTKVLPKTNDAVTVAAATAQTFEPLEDLVLGPYSAEFNLVVDAVVAAEQSWAVVGQQSGTGAQKAAEVFAIVEGQLMPKLQAAGLDTAAATTYLQKFIDAIVAILNGPSKPTTAPASN